jgi:hypothetical protein
VQLTAGAQAVTGRPEFPSCCALGAVCEAENALLGGYAATSYDHANHTGTGFVAGLEWAGATITHDVHVPSAGSYSLQVRYANHRGGDGQILTRSMSTVVNGSDGPRLSMAPTGDWDTWSVTTVPVTLRAGVNTIRLATKASDSAFVNIDGFAAE